MSAFKVIENIIYFVILILFILIVTSEKSLADGMLIKLNPYDYRWDYSSETKQEAIINHSNGIQKMIISVGIENDQAPQDLFWIFPIPSIPSEINIDIFESIPNLYGEEISKKAKANLEEIQTYLFASQVYTIPLVLFPDSLKTFNSDLFIPLGIDNFLETDSKDITVYEHIEKEGIVSEVLTAKTSSGLQTYLKDKGFELDISEVPALNNYIGGNYSFVVSWIDTSKGFLSEEEIKKDLYDYIKNPDEYPKFSALLEELNKKYKYLFDEARNTYEYLKSPQGENALQKIIDAIQKDPTIVERKEFQPYGSDLSNTINGKNKNSDVLTKGLFVSFRTDEIYFPLIPTSVYGNTEVPANIRVIGHVSPNIFDEIKDFTKVEYYLGNFDSDNIDLTRLFELENTQVKYTKIQINAPSNKFVEDLWISNKTPLKTYYSMFVGNNKVGTTLILLAISSMLSSLLVGFVLFKHLRRKPFKLILLGLTNCFSLIVFIFATLFTYTGPDKTEDVKNLLQEHRKKLYIFKRRIAFIISLTLIPLLAFNILVFPTIQTLLSSDLLNIFKSLVYEQSLPITELAYTQIVYYLLPYIVFFGLVILVVMFSRIKPYNRYIFKQLKIHKYSSWTYQPKSFVKLLFIPLFSFVFLVLSYCLVQIVEMTL